MPGFDGTGPQGRGPMSGNGRGYCLMNMPDEPGEAATGFAGLAGRPVTIGKDRGNTDMAMLQDRLRTVQAVLRGMELRLSGLEAGRGEE